MAGAAQWQEHAVTVYGHRETRHIADITCLWYGSWHTRTVRLILARDPASTRPCGIALITTGLDACPAALVMRYAARWAIGQAFAGARTIPGVGEARNRVRRAVERTVPFAMLASSIIVIWYARHGHDPAAITGRRRDQPWYAAKTEPAFEDMLTQLRRVLIVARISGGHAGRPTSEQIRAVTTAWAAAAA